MERYEKPHVLSRKKRNELGENSLWMGRHIHDDDDWQCGYKVGQASLATEINVLLMALKTVISDIHDDSANRWIIINMMSDLCASHSFEPEQRQIDKLSDVALKIGSFEYKLEAAVASEESASKSWSDKLKAKGRTTELDEKKN
tara:strand:- start:1170 stop:1601 length:432 start_codon:yes stop_codon:yes gene_type:complete